jgi:hypothetical protein
MSCEWRGNTTNGPRTSLLVVVKGNDFLKLKGFLLLVVNLPNSHFQLEGNILEYKDSKQQEEKKHSKIISI